MVVGSDMESFWRITTHHSLHWKRFDAERLILFNDASCQTHVLNVLCEDLLRLLRDFPDSSGALAEKLAQHHEMPLDEEFSTYFNNMLADLDFLGLIEPVAL